MSRLLAVFELLRYITFCVGDADLNDDFHDASHQIIESVRTGKTPLGLVTDFVIDELVTILGKRKGFGARSARDTGRAILVATHLQRFRG